MAHFYPRPQQNKRAMQPILREKERQYTPKEVYCLLLPSYAKLFNNASVSFNVFFLQVIEQSPSLSNDL